MVGFRDYEDYVRAYPEHGQQRCDGAPIQVEGSFYLVPTADRLELLRARYLRMVEAGAEGICLEEPEYWADAGYEPAFQQLYAQHYGQAWRPLHESHASRWRADWLKAELMNQMVHTLLECARLPPSGAPNGGSV